MENIGKIELIKYEGASTNIECFVDIDSLFYLCGIYVENKDSINRALNLDDNGVKLMTETVTNLIKECKKDRETLTLKRF